MPKLTRYVAASLILATAAGCDRSSQANAGAVRDSVGVSIVESAAPQLAETASEALLKIDARAQVTIGREQEGEAEDERYQLHRVTDALRLNNGQIAVSNSGTNEIRIFDSAGVFVRNIGRKGAGPGEFGEYSSARMYASRDTVLAEDNGAFRMHVYGADMQFIETRPFVLSGAVVRPFFRGVFSDGSWMALSFAGGGALNGPVGSIIRSAYSLVHFDASGRLLNEITKVDSRPRYVHQFEESIHFPFIPLTSEPLDATLADEVIVHRGPQPEIQVFDRAGKLRRIIRWSRQLVPARDIWAAYQKQSLESMSERQRASYAHLYTLDLPLPEFAPSYTAMLVDAYSNVWLRRFQLDGDPASPVWDVISRAGRWLGTVSTPSQFTVYRIGSNFILGRSRDSLGVERVELRRATPHALLGAP